jgi:hypothetical protein
MSQRRGREKEQKDQMPLARGQTRGIPAIRYRRDGRGLCVIDRQAGRQAGRQRCSSSQETTVQGRRGRYQRRDAARR